MSAPRNSSMVVLSLAAGVLVSACILPSGAASAQEKELAVEWPGGAKGAFVWVEPGTFTMGTTEEQKQLLRQRGLWEARFNPELPAHEVRITQGFYLGKYEITQGQWQAVMGTRPWSGQEYVQEQPDHPAVYLSWDDVQEFIHRLNTAAGDSLYRLPTEAEWEYTCRAGTDTEWFSGNDANTLGEYAWYNFTAWNREEKYAHAIGTKLPNPWGLYDMHGNVWEWCLDWYNPYLGESQVDPVFVTGSGPVILGGSFEDSAALVRSAMRYYGFPYSRFAHIGARVVLRRTSGSTSIVPDTWGSVKSAVSGSSEDTGR